MMKQYAMLMLVLVWAGCILAISFMESWLKFRAPGVTLPIGLGIGKLVFNALNKMEWVFAIFILLIYFFGKQQTDAYSMFLFVLPVCLLILQTFWWLPALDARANVVISGKTLPPSLLHWYFIGAEVVKHGSLLVLGYRLFKGSVVA